MGNISSINKINYEFVKNAINSNEYIIINTLDNNNQECLIKNTLSIINETNIINECIKTNKERKIIIYGINSQDNKVIEKYNQLYKLGFKNLYVYIGGLFEWLLLQDIYGDDEFPTTCKIIDILQYS